MEAEACGSKVAREAFGETTKIEGSWNNLRTGFSSTSHLLKNPPIQTVMEVTKRLRIELPNIFLIAVVPGPIRLSSYLVGCDFWPEIGNLSEKGLEAVEFSGEIILNMVKLYCEQRVNGILVVETLCVPEGLDSRVAEEVLESGIDEMLALLEEIFVPVQNLVKYYNSRLILFVEEALSGDRLRKVFELPVDSVSFGQPSDIKELQNAAKEGQKGFGIALPLQILKEPADKINEHISNISKAVRDPRNLAGNHLITEWEVPYNTTAQSFKNLMRSIKTYL